MCLRKISPLITFRIFSPKVYRARWSFMYIHWSVAANPVHAAALADWPQFECMRTVVYTPKNTNKASCVETIQVLHTLPSLVNSRRN
jgi:hypothetical protein